MRIILLILVAISLSGCDLIFDRLLDCIDQDRPQFNSNQMPRAILNNTYAYTISASIKHNPFDDNYNYHIYLVGNLPAGVGEIRDDNDRTLKIAGTPTEFGSFPFTVYVDVEDKYRYDIDDDTSLCESSYSQDYTLSVSVM